MAADNVPPSPKVGILGPGELVPEPSELAGREWHVGDPHTRYRFIRVLGTGHYGVTYLCQSLKSGEHCAIKALDKLHPEYEREVAMEEIRILAAVSDHPNVVNMYEVWEDASYIFIVMEACMGGELFDMVIERKHFSEADAASITAAVLSVMQHCHSKGIIHRDLKPENFLLLREGELSAENLRAIDFGLSKFVERGDICRTCVGSSYYVAPEVLRGAYSYEADAWSVGTITYILLSGFPPFWGSSDQVIFHRILNKPVDFDYQPWHLISAAAKDFVGRLLHKDPAQRMSVSEGLTHPWITEKATDVPLSTEIISRLQSFTQQNRVKCLLMTVAAHHLSDDEIGGLRKIFHFIDADHDGEISMHDLTVAMQHTGLDMEQQGVMRLLAGLDLAHHGTVHVEEFIAAALDQRKVLNSKNINTIFTELDRDHDGLITVKELQDALEECNISIKADTLGRLMDREGALDAKGMVSAKSFSDLLLNGQAAQPLELEAWMRDVHEFSSASAFKQLAMLVVARHMQPKEVESLRGLFQHLDEDATGTISMAQLQDAMRHMGKQVGEQELRQLLEALDIRHHGCIEYDEFLAACLEEQHLTETKLRAAFEFFDHAGSGYITQGDVVQVLQDVGMDASHAEEFMAAAAAAVPAGSPSSTAPGGGGPGSSPTPEGGSTPEGGTSAAPSEPSSRSISYEDFRRLLLGPSPPAIITKALSRVNSLSSLSSASRSSSRSVSRTSSGMLEVPPPVVPAAAAAAAAHPRLATALESIARSSTLPRPGDSGAAPTAAALAAAAAAAAGSPSPSKSPQLTLPPERQRQAFQAQQAYLPPAENDFMPDYSDVEESPRVDGGGGGTRRFVQFDGMGPEPPSPISLMPRYEPPSPIDLRPRQEQQEEQEQEQRGSPLIDLRPRYEPPSPISLLPRPEPPSPGGAGGGRGRGSPGYRPYSAYSAGPTSPLISLSAARDRGPASPMAGGGLGASEGSGIMSPTARGAGGGTGGLTLQQILQQYSSSGYKSRGASSRRSSIDMPAGGRRTSADINRNSVLSQSSYSDVDDSWLGNN